MSAQRKIESFTELIAAQGAEFCGLQDGPKGSLILFTDLVTNTTLALAECDFSAESLARRLNESRRKFGVVSRLEWCAATNYASTGK